MYFDVSWEKLCTLDEDLKLRVRHDRGRINSTTGRIVGRQALMTATEGSTDDQITVLLKPPENDKSVHLNLSIISIGIIV